MSRKKDPIGFEVFRRESEHKSGHDDTYGVAALRFVSDSAADESHTVRRGGVAGVDRMKRRLRARVLPDPSDAGLDICIFSSDSLCQTWYVLLLRV